MCLSSLLKQNHSLPCPFFCGHQRFVSRFNYHLSHLGANIISLHFTVHAPCISPSLMVTDMARMLLLWVFCMSARSMAESLSLHRLKVQRYRLKAYRCNRMSPFPCTDTKCRGTVQRPTVATEWVPFPARNKSAEVPFKGLPLQQNERAP
jgi:hypothetical protein